jgi:hypothetical protein
MPVPRLACPRSEWASTCRSAAARRRWRQRSVPAGGGRFSPCLAGKRGPKVRGRVKPATRRAEAGMPAALQVRRARPREPAPQASHGSTRPRAPASPAKNPRREARMPAYERAPGPGPGPSLRLVAKQRPSHWHSPCANWRSRHDQPLSMPAVREPSSSFGEPD